MLLSMGGAAGLGALQGRRAALPRRLQFRGEAEPFEAEPAGAHLGLAARQAAPARQERG